MDYGVLKKFGGLCSVAQTQLLSFAKYKAWRFEKVW
jgi:hypothetical protein